MTDLQYDPLFVPGDILKIDFPDESIICLITASTYAGAVEEVLSGHPARYYHVLYFSDTDGFVHHICMEDYLKEHAERIGHLDWNEATCGGADVAEVLFENRALNDRLKGMTSSRDHWMKMYGLAKEGLA